MPRFLRLDMLTSCTRPAFISATPWAMSALSADKVAACIPCWTKPLREGNPDSLVVLKSRWCLVPHARDVNDNREVPQDGRPIRRHNDEF